MRYQKIVPLGILWLKLNLCIVQNQQSKRLKFNQEQIETLSLFHSSLILKYMLFLIRVCFIYESVQNKYIQNVSLKETIKQQKKLSKQQIYLRQCCKIQIFFVLQKILSQHSFNKQKKLMKIIVIMQAEEKQIYLPDN
ncbi:hypothetical protein TTHERM_000190728 (macronuclear) [Tetrahymena thermophila SB210]|uniref:Uncharacterized protein n=1 Tax=Tetrahymena thermophila (strain SB210) TaxID=312017 RepID=W7XCF7_TETTS|nr:hypothetical protein TTHERM_000190728 [Tetrahymena thermophila SB210]EWS74243.1 hypothetical protein TTHERM_000190728 [Tetrahymena thermophila SB210]|eukprot:XP_012653216.1 hypothetical protein TTHERM_000190728 [Tetrahymena thermophila SB210]